MTRYHVLYYGLSSRELFDACWSTTCACNLACPICCDIACGATASITTKLAVANALIRLPVQNVTFTGGEPLLDPHIFDLIQHVSSRGVQTYINTNGLLLDSQSIARLSALGTHMGLPMDGSTAAIHALHRGSQDHHGHVLQLLEKLRVSHTAYDVTTVVTRLNVEDIPRIGALVSRLKVPKWRLTQFSALGRGRLHAERFQLSAREFDNAALAAITAAKDVRVHIRPDIASRLRAFFLLLPGGDIYLADGEEYAIIGNILTCTDTSSLLAGAGFRFDVHRSCRKQPEGS